MARRFACIVLALAGCLYPDLSEFERCADGACPPSTGAGAAGSGGASPTTSSTSSAPTSSSTGTGNDGGGGNVATGPCDLGPAQTGSPGIENPGAPGRCIDVRETTFDEYEAFRVAMSPAIYDALPIDHQVCAFKQDDGEDYLPVDYVWNTYNLNPTTYGPMPVIGLDWCSALVYCHVAGKSLCGKSDGSPIDTSSAGWASMTELTKACIADAAELPTDGCTSTQGCSPNGLHCAAPADMGCVGSAGLFHMQSNAVEFEDNCVADGGSFEDDECLVRGLNYADDAQGGGGGQPNLPQTCTWPSPDPVARAVNQPQGGIRCCWDAQ